MSATDELRRMLDERGVEWGTNETLTDCWTRWNAGKFRCTATEVNGTFAFTVGNSTPEQAVESTLGNEESYTRDDVESAFVSGYSLGCLPVGSDPQWDENEQTVDEHMAELGWVRAATVGAGTCKVESSVGIEFNTLISPDYFEFEMSCGSRFSWSDNEPPDYCPGCGRKVMDE